MAGTRVFSGIDGLQQEFRSEWQKRKIVLVANSSAVDSRGNPTSLIIKRLFGSQLKAIWSLQHGFYNDQQDNMRFSNSFVSKTLAVEVKSLYQANLVPDEEWLGGIDTIVADIQDVGCRVYTFVNHLVLLMKAISGRGIDFFVLDRPNPLNGRVYEGNVSLPGYFSLVGQLPVPMRHGLTVAEYLSLAREYLRLDINLKVFKVKNWQRKDFYDGVWLPPSPNMPSFSTALVYPGAVLLEGTTLSEGRGTTRPFEIIGAPFMDNIRVGEWLNRFRFKGLRVVPVSFKPEFSKFKGEVCHGVLFHVEKPRLFTSFEPYYELIRIVFHLYPSECRWQEPPYEFETKRLPIDMITGGYLIRQAIEADRPYSALRSQIDSEIESFRTMAQKHFLYS